MKAEEIKYKIEIYEMLNTNISRNKQNLENSFKKTIDAYNDSIKKLKDEIYKLRSICKHKYKEKPTVMGKGKCIICGHDDY